MRTTAISRRLMMEMRQQGRGPRNWVRVAVPDREQSSRTILCPRCTPAGMPWTVHNPGDRVMPEHTLPVVVVLTRFAERVEGWLGVDYYLGWCDRCGTTYWA